jgi:hypothetical protein
MNVSVLDVTAAQFINSLTALKNILQKAHTFAEMKKIDFNVLLQTRLVPDQFPLIRQVLIACDSAKLGVSRLTGVEAPVYDDKEQTLEELLTRIDNTVTFLKKVKPENFNGFETKVIRFPWKPGLTLDGMSFLTQHVIPNFYFHITTAYSILRASGVEIGKGDYLGQQSWKAEA